MQKWENLEKSQKNHEEEKDRESKKLDELRVELEQDYVKLQETRSTLGKKEDRMMEERNLTRKERVRMEETHVNELSKHRKSELTRVISASLFCLIVGLCISFSFLYRPCDPNGGIPQLPD